MSKTRKTVIKTLTLKDVEVTSQKLGDDLASRYYLTEGLSYAVTALAAYRTAFAAIKLQIQMGKPNKKQ